MEVLGRYLLEAGDQPSWDKKALHQLLYGKEKPFREQALYDAFSQLNRLLDRFLTLRAFENDQPAKQRFLLDALAQHQLEEAYQRHWKKARLSWEKHPYRDLDYFEGQYSLYRQASVFEAGLQRRDQDDRLEATVHHLDLHYWTARLKYSCELLNRNNILNQPPPEALIQPLDVWLTHFPAAYQSEPAVQAYWLTFHALKNPDEESHFTHWIEWLDENSHQFSPLEAADLYNYAQNYCIRRINQGDTGYLSRLFTLFEQLLAKGLVLDQGFMDHRKLKNMVTVGIRLQAFEWVDDFLHTYRDKLLPAYQTDAYLFNLASLRYAQGQHSEALTLLQKVEFKDVFYHLSARSLMLKLYYETDEDAALEVLLETFRLYLKRNRAISAFQRRIHLNLVRFTKKLHRLREQKGILASESFQERLAKLSNLIHTADEVANRSWLLEQVENL